MVHGKLQYSTLCPALLLGLGRQEREETEDLFDVPDLARYF